MTRRTRTHKSAVLLAIVGVTALAGYWASGLLSPDAVPWTATDPSTSTPTAEYPNPIFDAQDAINRSLARFPEGHNPHGEIARLVTYETLADVWFEEPREPIWDPSAGVWLVAILGNELMVNDVLPPPHVPSAQMTADAASTRATDPIFVEGAYYGWDANGGLLVVEGALAYLSGPLAGTEHRTYSLIQSLPNENPSIAEATELPLLIHIVATNAALETQTATP